MGKGIKGGVATMPLPPEEPSVPPRLYYVSIKLDQPSSAGDHEYHVEMTEEEIYSIFDGVANFIRLPQRFGGKTETRFLSMTNVVEITIDALEIAPRTTIAETRP